ncbi:SDR family NAD(P)-dependent oxidoreductase [Paraburkholderia strydomiana]|uniref:SDR family NAD(P)-dependent oxidoreductase n=1 Tax=Paraburkholderia strydomiana TaxID=1245417 RepID=UPI0038BA7828
MATDKTALIIGASRGLGLALASEFSGRQYNVIATSRGSSPKLAELEAQCSGRVTTETVDVVDLESVRALYERLNGHKLDVLFVNAGVCKANELTPLQVDESDFLDMMLTNALSPMRIVEMFHNLVAENGVIAVMSSEIGSIENSAGFWELYSSSKAALNMLMKAFSQRHPQDSRALLLVAPGWVRTDMGGSNATLDISESIPLVVDMIEANFGVPGLRFTDRYNKAIPW